MKRFLVISFVALALFAVIACNNNQSVAPAPAPTTVTTKEIVEVGDVVDLTAFHAEHGSAPTAVKFRQASTTLRCLPGMCSYELHCPYDILGGLPFYFFGEKKVYVTFPRGGADSVNCRLTVKVRAASNVKLYFAGRVAGLAEVRSLTKSGGVLITKREYAGNISAAPPVFSIREPEGLVAFVFPDGFGRHLCVENYEPTIDLPPSPDNVMVLGYPPENDGDPEVWALERDGSLSHWGTTKHTIRNLP